MNTNHHENSPDPCSPDYGLIIANYGKEVLLEDFVGARHRCIVRAHLPNLVCGDHVTWKPAEQGLGTIEQLGPRHGVLTSQAKDGSTRVVAANIDCVAVVVAAQPRIQTRMLDRYLSACEMAEITPIIIFNKIDLLQSPQQQEIHQVLQIYRTLGYETFYVSVKTHENIADLKLRLHGRMSVLVGQSGVGKSSLIKALIPASQVRIGDLTSQQGRHTTSHSELYHLDTNGHLIDSPGVRSFSLGKVSLPQLMHSFIEFREHLGQCRFLDCTHQHEPACAVKNAVSNGSITEERYQCYLELVKNHT